uniref:EGF-like domain-containing protein n=1 Tax=Macrostomum lignano TaxID=282301 RepID=A0A1I8JS66_9PLAT
PAAAAPARLRWRPLRAATPVRPRPLPKRRHLPLRPRRPPPWRLPDPLPNCRRHYSGTNCANFDCMAYLNNCNGLGPLRLLQRAPTVAAQCENGYTGSTCDIRPELCGDFDCRNGGLCRVISGRRSCDCSRSGYLSEPGSDGLCTPPGPRAGRLLRPPRHSAPTHTTPTNIRRLPDVSRHRHHPDVQRHQRPVLVAGGEDGQLKINRQGVRHVINARPHGGLDNGGYHTVYIERLGGQFRVFVDDQLAPVLSTSLDNYKSNMSSFPYHQIIFGANSDGQNLFSGTVGNFRWNGEVFGTGSFPGQRQSGPARTTSSWCPFRPLCASRRSAPTRQAYCGRFRHLQGGKLWTGLRLHSTAIRGRAATRTYQARTVLATVSNRPRGQFWQLFLKGGAVHLRGLHHRRPSDCLCRRGQRRPKSPLITGRREGQTVLSVDKVRAQEDLYALHRDLLEPDRPVRAPAACDWAAATSARGVGRPETAICFVGALR